MKTVNQTHLHLISADEPVKLYKPSYTEDQEPLAYSPVAGADYLRTQARKLNGLCTAAVVSIVAMLVGMFVGADVLVSAIGFAYTLTLLFVCLFLAIPLTFVVVAAASVGERLKMLADGKIPDEEWEEEYV